LDLTLKEKNTKRAMNEMKIMFEHSAENLKASVISNSVNKGGRGERNGRIYS